MNIDLAPTGTFCVGMNGNNATLVIRGADGTGSGLSADLGRFIAGKLGVPYEPVLYGSAAPFTASFRKSEWDIILTFAVAMGGIPHGFHTCRVQCVAARKKSLSIVSSTSP